ncbi:XtrA/YqaO family protein [Sinobaca qinghaiensis]
MCDCLKRGKAKLKELPKHGETKVITHQWKVKRIRYEEGEDF